MTWFWGIALPALVQMAAVAGVVVATNGGGSFVGLGALLTSLVALPLTALANALALRRQPPLHPLVLAARIMYTTLLYPLLLALAATLAT